MSIAYDSKIVVSRYEHLHGRLVCYKRRNLPDERRTLLNRASYLYGNDQTTKYSFQMNEQRQQGL